MFDHADIYRAGRYRFSGGHILDSADGILQRLGTDYLDILALHRPDPLMDAEEVAGAFTELHAGGDDCRRRNGVGSGEGDHVASGVVPALRVGARRRVALKALHVGLPILDVKAG